MSESFTYPPPLEGSAGWSSGVSTISPEIIAPLCAGGKHVGMHEGSCEQFNMEIEINRLERNALYNELWADSLRLFPCLFPRFWFGYRKAKRKAIEEANDWRAEAAALRNKAVK